MSRSCTYYLNYLAEHLSAGFISSHFGKTLLNLIPQQEFLGDLGENTILPKAHEMKSSKLGFQSFPVTVDGKIVTEEWIYKAISPTEKYPVSLYTDGQLTTYMVDPTKINTTGLPVIKNRMWYP